MAEFRPVKKFPNAVEIGGRLTADPDRVRNAMDDQARFDLAWPFREDKAYYIEVNIFGENAALALDGDEHHRPLRKGDTVLIRGTLASYSKAVIGQKGRFHVRRVSVNAKEIHILKRSGRSRAEAPVERDEEPDRKPHEPGFDDEL